MRAGLLHELVLAPSGYTLLVTVCGGMDGV